MKTLDRRDCRILPLVLAGKWYWMIDRGEKTEEYRDRTRYWETRIRKWWRMRFGTPHKMIVEFRFAYGTNAPRMAFEVAELYKPTVLDVVAERTSRRLKPQTLARMMLALSRAGAAVHPDGRRGVWQLVYPTDELREKVEAEADRMNAHRPAKEAARA